MRVNSIVTAAALLTLGTQTSARPQDPVFRAGVDLVNLAVSVTDRQGRLVTDLTADSFEVLEDGVPQTVSYFSSGGTPASAMHLGVLLDVSSSMERDIGFMQTASIKFLKTLSEATDITFVDFDDEVRVARYNRQEMARLVERIRGKAPRGETALFDAIGVYLERAAEQEGRKVMLLYTDGGDSRSALRMGELLELLKASDVTVYAIGALERGASNVHPAVIQQIAALTGGQTFFPASPKELDKAYQQVLDSIRGQYSLGYVSTNQTLNGAWRKVVIKLKRPDARTLRIRARSGYYAPHRP